MAIYFDFSEFIVIQTTEYVVGLDKYYVLSS